MGFARTHARQDGTDTSKSAAEAARLMTAAQKHKIYAALKRVGPLTGHEIAPYIGIDAHKIMKRTADLLREGAIEDSGARRLTPSGRLAIVWRVVKPQAERAPA